MKTINTLIVSGSDNSEKMYYTLTLSLIEYARLENWFLITPLFRKYLKEGCFSNVFNAGSVIRICDVNGKRLCIWRRAIDSLYGEEEEA